MEAFIREQLLPTAVNLPLHWGASYLKKKTSPDVEAARRKAGGFIKGVCHPKTDYDLVRGAGIQWVRPDIKFPFDAHGNIRQEYLDWKAEWQIWRDKGIRLLAVTPYPREFINAGMDPRLPENEARVRETAIFLMEDLRGLVDGFQITNEMGVPRFTKPLNMDEAARFVGIQLEAMYPRRGELLVGFNAAGPQANLFTRMRPYFQYCDYVGVDVYIGCFVPVANWLWIFDMVLRYIWSMTGKPVILCEFGYISGGAPKTADEKRAVLQRYGANSEKEARENIDAFMENIKRVSPKIHEYTVKNASGDYADFLFQLDFCNHFYSELPAKTVIKAYPHTPEGQAGFYRDLYPRMARLPFLLGAFVYCWKDSEKCYVCGQDDCPTETRWGLVDMQGREKPSYYAVRDALARL